MYYALWGLHQGSCSIRDFRTFQTLYLHTSSCYFQFASIVIQILYNYVHFSYVDQTRPPFVFFVLFDVQFNYKWKKA